MAAINRVIRLALGTFKTTDGYCSEEGFSRLRAELSKLSASGIDISTPGNAAHLEQFMSTRAPVLHVHIFGNSRFTVGVFILKDGKSIPLHDHPGMKGLCKVLYGHVHLKSYSNIVNNEVNGMKDPVEGHHDNLIPTQLHSDRIVSWNDEAITLNEHFGNYHAIESKGGPAAFIDVLAPPYDESMGRDCHYFKEVSGEALKGPSDLSSTIRWLLPVSSPREFYCSSLPYTGPGIQVDPEDWA